MKVNSVHEESIVKGQRSKVLQSGTTLIETLIYIALVSTIVGGILFSTFFLLNSSSSLQTKVVAEEEANFILKKMEWALTGFETINSPASGSSAGSISINKYNYSSNPIVFDLDSGNIRIQKAGGSATILNSSQTTITSLNFEHIAAQGSGPDGIKATLTMNGRNYQLVIYKKK